MIEQACRSAVAWESRLPVAVNVSLLQLYDGDLQTEIAAILLRTGLPAELLEIEVTESVMADDNPAVLETLRTLKTMGIRIALDDFGTGYSSLSYLRRFTFDKIKIDRTFVQGQAHDQGVRVILEAILGMCHKLGLAAVGEGVETRQQLSMLRQCGCTEVQGYLLGRPIPASAVEMFVQNNLRQLNQESRPGGRGNGIRTRHLSVPGSVLEQPPPQLPIMPGLGPPSTPYPAGQTKTWITTPAFARGRSCGGLT